MIYDTLKEALREKWASGKSQTELGAEAGVSQVHINRLLNQPADIWGNVALGTVLRLFPEMEITLGQKGTITQTGVNSIQAGRDIRITVASGILRRVRRALLSADMCDKCKLAAIAAIMSVESEEE